MTKTATISECGKYRYDLTRTWDEDAPRVLWVMLNLSTADAEIDDPTIRRCVAFSKAWSFGGLVVVNLFALRATDPRELYKSSDPCGPLNNEHLCKWAACPLRVAAWGVHGQHRTMGLRVKAMFNELRAPLSHLGLTQDGQPKHPLYLKGDLMPREWNA